MASSSTDSWVLSLDDWIAKSKARSGNARVLRVPDYIRSLKPKKYDPDILPMGMFNRDFRKETPMAMDQLKLEIASAFLVHLKLHVRGWEKFCTEVEYADSHGQVPPRGAPGQRLEHFYEDYESLKPEQELSVLIIDSFFIVAVLMRGDPALPNVIVQIFARRGVACLMTAIDYDIFWLYESQIPLFLVANVWAKVVKASGAENQSGEFSFHDVIIRCLRQRLSSAGFPYGEVNGDYNNCEHLLECLHRALCSGHGIRPSRHNESETRPLKQEQTEQSTLLDQERTTKSPGTLPSATRLRKAGIRCKGVETNIGDIRFEKSWLQLTATLYLPKMTLFQDMSEKLLLNLCVYEYMNAQVPHDVTHFVQFMDELIDSEEDVDVLRHGNHPVIAANFLGDNKQVANIFANTLQHFTLKNNARLEGIRSEINTWHKVQWRRHLIGFVERFALAPWLLISMIAATILLVLTLLQTIYTLLGFYK